MGEAVGEVLTFQLTSHMQNSINKEERMLHQTLGDKAQAEVHHLPIDQLVAACNNSTSPMQLE